MREKRQRGESAAPYYPETAERETAKNLRLQAQRFLADRATRADLSEACAAWLATQPEPAK